MTFPRARERFNVFVLLVLLSLILGACSSPALIQTPTAVPSKAATAITAESPAAATTAPAPSAVPTGTAPEGTEAPAEPTGAASPAGNVLRVNFGGEPNTIDPQKASVADEIPLIMLNYLPLLTFDTDLKLVPGAAASWDLSEDGTTYTFHLRPDMTYSDGEPLTAANFEYGWKRLCDPTIAGEYASIGYPIAGCREYVEAFDTGGLTLTDELKLDELRKQVGVTAVDANTLEIRLKEAAPWFINVAALWVGVPVRQDLVESAGENWWADPATYIGNGPFQLTEWEHQGRVRFERNESYVLDVPKVEAIEAAMFNDSAVAFEAYRSGELDIYDVAPDDMETISADPALTAQLTKIPGACTSYIGFNTRRAPFDKKEVRQAWAMAFDRERWIEDVLGGTSAPLASFIPRGMPGYDPDLKGWEYNPGQARVQLESAGVDLSQELAITYGGGARGRAYFEYLAAMFENNLGVTIKLDPAGPETAEALAGGDFSQLPLIFSGAWCGDYPDPQNYLSLVFQPGGLVANRTGWSSTEYNDLTTRADKLPVGDPERARLYKAAQALLVDEAPVIFSSQNQTIQLVQPWIKNLRQTPIDFFPGIFGIVDLEIVADE